jgi:hypothetical protein
MKVSGGITPDSYTKRVKFLLRIGRVLAFNLLFSGKALRPQLQVVTITWHMLLSLTSLLERPSLNHAWAAGHLVSLGLRKGRFVVGQVIGA